MCAIHSQEKHVLAKCKYDEVGKEAGRGGLTVRVRSVCLNFKHRRRVAAGNQDGMICYVLETTCFLERLAEI